MECPNCKSDQVVMARRDDNKLVCMDCACSWEKKGEESHASASALSELEERLNKRFDKLESTVKPKAAGDPPPDDDTKTKKGKEGDDKPKTKSYFE